MPTIKEAREAKGLSLRQTVDKSGGKFSLKTLHFAETGKRKYGPRSSTIAKIAKTLEVDPSDLRV